MNRPIITEESLNEVLWAHFPGFEEAFHTILPVARSWIEEMDLTKLETSARLSDAHARVYEITDAYLEAIRRAKRTDCVCDVFICIVPDIVWANCRPMSRIKGGVGDTPNARERRLRGQM